MVTHVPTPSSHLSVGVHCMLRPCEANRVPHLFLGLVSLHTYCYPSSTVFVWPCTILDEKASIPSHFIVFTASYKSVRWGIGLAVVSFLRESSTWHAWPVRWYIPQSIQWDRQLICLTFLRSLFMIQLIVGVPRMTGTLDPNVQSNLGQLGQLGLHYSPFTPSTWTFMMTSAQGLGKTIPQTHLFSEYHLPDCSRDSCPKNEPWQTLE